MSKPLGVKNNFVVSGNDLMFMDSIDTRPFFQALVGSYPTFTRKQAAAFSQELTSPRQLNIFKDRLNALDIRKS